MLSLALALLLSQTPQHRLFQQPNLPRSSLAFFEAFPASGAGTSGPCSTTAPTGARGEQLTFTRASAATCTRTAAGGLATTGISDGDLVSVSSSVARVEYDSNGVLGLLVEAARTNSCLRSQEITDAAWVAYGYGAAAASKGAADSDVAPDGTTTAERVTFNIATAAQASIVYQATACPASVAATGTIYAKGTTASGSIDICLQTAATVYSCAACAFVTDSWSRCSVTGTTVGTPVFLVGHNGTASATISGSGRAFPSAQTVMLWGADCENGAYATSYIPTTSAAVARAAESPYFTVSIPGPTYSIAASFERVVTIDSSSARVATLYQDGTHFTDDYFPAKLTAYLFDGAADSKAHSASVTTSGRVGSYYDGTNLAACVAGVCETVAAAATWTAWTRVRIGCDGAGCSAGHINGIVSRVQVDMAATRAR